MSSPQLAVAKIEGSDAYPHIRGYVWFQDVPLGTLVCTSILGLPAYKPATDDTPPIGPFAFHLHEGDECGSKEGPTPFLEAGSHYAPDQQPHGNHAGDFPVLFSYHGMNKMCFFTDRFTLQDIIGKAVVIHEHPDDYKSQPSGDAGIRIACGTIRAIPFYNFYPYFL